MYLNQIFISPHFIPEDFINLYLKKSSDTQTWEKAISIFMDRIEGRFFNAIELLIEHTKHYPENCVDYTFSVMGLMCMLIETLHQFYNGIDETERYYHKDAFIKFLISSRHFNYHFGYTEAKIFYRDIRNGILHQSQTKNNSQLTILSEKMFEMVDNGIRIDVMLFYDALKKEVNDYMDRLRNMNEVKLRENFIIKMKYITEINMKNNNFV